MADLEDSSLQSVADWLTPTNPFQFKYPFSSNDFQLHSHSFSILWDETGDNAPEKDPGEYTYPQSPLTGLDNLYSVDTLCDPDASLTLPLPVPGTWGMCKYAEAKNDYPQMPTCDARQQLYHASTENFDSDIAGSGSSRSQAEQSSGPKCGLKNAASCDRSHRRHSHNEVEKRYRQNLDRGFRHLKDILGHHAEKTNQKAKTEILDEAYNYIVELRGKVEMLQAELKNTRETLFPDTCKYTLADG